MTSTAGPPPNNFNTKLEASFVETTYFNGGFATARAVVASNSIAVLHGPSGTGKTTTALFVANSLDRPAVVVTMHSSGSPLDLLRRLCVELTGTMHNGTRIQMENDLKILLRDWGGVCVFDEMQDAGRSAMEDIVFLYEETDHAFATVIVGSESLQTVRQHPQLLTRVMGHERFEPLVGKALVDAVRGMDPRFAATPSSLIGAHDQRCCRGLLRGWIQTLRWTNTFGIDGPLTSEDLEMITEKIPDPDIRPEPRPVLVPGARRARR